MTPVVARVSSSWSETVARRWSDDVPADQDRPRHHVVRPLVGLSSDRAIPSLTPNVVHAQADHLAGGANQRAVAHDLAQVLVTDDGQRDVRAVVQVDREPVPAAAAHGHEVAPLVVEPGDALDLEALAIELRARRSRSCASASSSRRIRPAPKSTKPSPSCRTGAFSARRSSASPNEAPAAVASSGVRAASIRSVPFAPASRHGASAIAGAPAATSSGLSPPTLRSKPVGTPGGVPRRSVDLRSDLAALGIDEPVPALVGEGQVGCPGGRNGAALRPEHDRLEPEPASIRRPGGDRCSTTTPSADRAGRRPAAGRSRWGRQAAKAPGSRRPADGKRIGGFARIGAPPQPPRTNARATTNASGVQRVVMSLPRRPRASAGVAPRRREATSSSAPAGASSMAPAMRGRSSRRARPRSRSRPPAP